MSPIYKSLCIAFILQLFYCHVSQSQNLTVVDTFSIISQLRDEAKYNQAISLLKKYEPNHPHNILFCRLHAQILFWMKNYKELHVYTQKTMAKNPSEQILKIDYAGMLIEMNQLNESKKLIDKVLISDSLNLEALILMGKIAFWQQNYDLA